MMSSEGKSFIRRLVLLVISMALASGCVHSTNRDQSQVDRLARGFLVTLSQSDKDAFIKASKDDLPMFHFGAGSRVRQMYFGPDGQGRKALCVKVQYCDIDKQSMRIVERTWEIIQGAS
jgi:hypothetical protein